MTQTVIVPLDGSALSETAVPVAEWLAVAFGVRLVLLRSRADPSEVDAGALDEVIERHPTLAQTEMVVSDMSPVAAILAEVEASPEPLVCMATHGRGGLGRAVLGSVMEQVLRLVRVPVLVLGPHAAESSGRGGLVVCLDASSDSDKALPVAVALAADLAVSTTVVTVVPRGDPAFSRVHEASPGRLLEAVYRFRAAHLRAYPLTVKGVDAARTVDRVARDRDAALIVLARRPHAAARAVLGSTALALVHRSPCPVLIAAP